MAGSGRRPAPVAVEGDHLAAVWSNSRRTGSRRLIVAGVVEDLNDRRQLESATGGPVMLCRLDAPDADLAQRIHGRAREGGASLTNLVARAAELSAQLTANDASDFAINTAARTIDDIADEVLTHWRSAE